MIDHSKKLIFIHIQRTGGTFLEKQIWGNDIWFISPQEKHLIASQAKQLYRDYWESYTKISIVRDPFARTVSMLRFFSQFFLTLDEQRKIQGIEEYLKKYSYNGVVLENDYRFSKIENLVSDVHQPNQIYLNLLDEPVDRVFIFENLIDDMEELCDLTKTKISKDAVNLGSFEYSSYYTETLKETVSKLYENDIQKFGFAFGQGKLNTLY